MKKILHELFGVSEEADIVAAMLDNMMAQSDDISATCKFAAGKSFVPNTSTRIKIYEHIRHAHTQAVERNWPVTAMLLSSYANVNYNGMSDRISLSKQECVDAVSVIAALSERAERDDVARRLLEQRVSELDAPMLAPSAKPVKPSSGIRSILYEFADHSPNEVQSALIDHPSECAAYMTSQLRQISAHTDSISALIVAMLFGFPKQMICFEGDDVDAGIICMCINKYGTNAFCEKTLVREIISGDYELDQELRYYIMAMVGAGKLARRDSRLISAAHANACKLMQAIRHDG